jgi:hypothetical protein
MNKARRERALFILGALNVFPGSALAILRRHG